MVFTPPWQSGGLGSAVEILVTAAQKFLQDGTECLHGMRWGLSTWITVWVSCLSLAVGEGCCDPVRCVAVRLSSNANFVVLGDGVSLCSPGWPVELIEILLLQPPECWGYRRAPPCPVARLR